MATRADAIRPLRTADLVAAALRRRILSGDLADGDVLPPEATLLAEFSVSRPSLREALRILETEGLISIRRGKLGGCVVHSPRAESAAYHFGLVLQSEHVPLYDLAAGRRVLEPACAAMAAARPDAEIVARHLNHLVDQSAECVDDGVTFTSTALHFHQALIGASGNQTLALLVGALEAVWSVQESEWAESAVSEGHYPDPSLRRMVIRAHRRIAHLIAGGAVDDVAHAVRQHLEASQEYLAPPQSGLVQVVAPGLARNRAPMADGVGDWLRNSDTARAITTVARLSVEGSPD
jgi:DNA-binding FadR family transcriptional regulator